MQNLDFARAKIALTVVLKATKLRYCSLKVMDEIHG